MIIEDDHSVYLTYKCVGCGTPTRLIEVPQYRYKQEPARVPSCCCKCSGNISQIAYVFKHVNKARFFMRTGRKA